jgi:hypothetical protein
MDLIEEISTIVNDYTLDELYHGCASGVISELIYYYQTEAFFDRHSSRLLDFLNMYKDCIDFSKFEFSKNNIVWLIFDIIAPLIKEDSDQ